MSQMRKSLFTRFRVPVLFALFVLLLPALTFAQAKLTVVHGISGSPLGLPADLPVDIWVNGAPFLTGVVFTNTAGPVTLDAGDYAIEIFLAGADPQTENPVMTLDATLTDGADVTVVAHLTPGPGIALTPFVNNATPQITDAVSPRISERDVRLTVRHAADFPRVAINRLVNAFEPTLMNGEALSVDLSPGEYSFWLSRAGGVRPTSFAPITVALAGGTAYQVYAIGSPTDGSFQLLILTDTFN